MKTYQAFSYAHENVSKEIIQLQKLVFEKYNLPLVQIVDNIPHGDFLNEQIKNSDTDYIIFFDIDCIPLTSKLYDIILNEIKHKNSIIGIEQVCNSNSLNHTYAGPACLGLSRELYKELGMPNLRENYRSDVGEELTWACENKGYEVKYFNVHSTEVPKWKLSDNRMFGIGTVYTFKNEEVLYHQFEIRISSFNFIDKCNKILDNT